MAFELNGKIITNEMMRISSQIVDLQSDLRRVRGRTYFSPQIKSMDICVLEDQIEELQRRLADLERA